MDCGRAGCLSVVFLSFSILFWIFFLLFDHEWCFVSNGSSIEVALRRWCPIIGAIFSVPGPLWRVCQMGCFVKLFCFHGHWHCEHRKNRVKNGNHWTSFLACTKLHLDTVRNRTPTGPRSDTAGGFIPGIRHKASGPVRRYTGLDQVRYVGDREWDCHALRAGHHHRDLGSADFLRRSARRISGETPLGESTLVLSANAKFLLDSDFRFPSRNSPPDLLFFPSTETMATKDLQKFFTEATATFQKSQKGEICSMLSTWMSTVLIQ